MTQTKDRLDSSIYDVRIYSEGLITAMENKNISEIEDYVKKMQHLLGEILKDTDLEKSKIKSKMTFKK